MTRLFRNTTTNEIKTHDEWLVEEYHHCEWLIANSSDYESMTIDEAMEYNSSNGYFYQELEEVFQVYEVKKVNFKKQYNHTYDYYHMDTSGYYEPLTFDTVEEARAYMQEESRWIEEGRGLLINIVIRDLDGECLSSELVEQLLYPDLVEQ